MKSEIQMQKQFKNNKRSDSAKRQWERYGFKERMKRIHKKRCEDPEIRKQRSIEQKARWDNLEYKKKQVEKIKKGYTEESSKKKSETIKKSWNNPETRKNRIDGMHKYHEFPEHKEKHRLQNISTAKQRSKTMKQLYSNPERRKEHSELMLKVMSQPDISEKMKLEGKKRKGKSLQQLSHESNCSCTFCKQKRGDNSWITKEIRDKKSKVHKETIRKNPEKWKEIYIKAGEESFKANLRNRPYIWNGVNFMSKLEMKCAKLLLTEPIDGVNCNIRINGKFIDFFPQLEDKLYIGCLVEYHPWDSNKLTNNEYYEKRNELKETSEFKDIPLIVITSLDEIEDDEKKKC